MRAGPARSSAAALIVALPDLLAAALAGSGVVLMALLVSGHFTPGLTIPGGLIGAAVAATALGISGEHRVGLPAEPGGTVAAVVGVAAWFAYNVRFTAEDVYATRDPATYTITGRWLVDHGSLLIQTHPDVFGSPPGAEIASGSYAQVTPTALNAQGDHLLPAFIGWAGSVFGPGAIFRVNLVLAALALLVLFGFARRLVGSPMALGVTGVLAVSMPYLYVARDSFTEPLTMAFLTGGLGLLQRGWLSGRRRDFALAGLVGGAAAMVRVDSYLMLIGFVAAGAVLLASAPAERLRERAGAVAALGGFGAVPAVLGWLDLTRLSRQYYGATHSDIVLAMAALFAALALAPVVVIVGRRARVRQWAARADVQRRVAWLLVLVLVVVFAGLASRPLWQVTRGARDLNLENMQARWGHAVDGTRTYNEQTVHWLALYFGWPTVVLGVAGYAALLADAVRRHALALTGALVTGLTASLLYLWTSQVAPDQPWATRRYVPIVLPMLLVAAATAGRRLWRTRAAIGRAVGPRAGRVAASVAVAAATLALVFPAAVTWPMRSVREESGQLAQLQALCRAIGPQGAVVLVDDEVIFGYGQSLRSFCGVPTIGLPGAGASQLAATAEAVRKSGRNLFVLAQDPAAMRTALAAAAVPAPFSVANVQRWPNQINVAPDQPDHQRYTMYLAQERSGRLVPVPPTG